MPMMVHEELKERERSRERRSHSRERTPNTTLTPQRSQTYETPATVSPNYPSDTMSSYLSSAAVPFTPISPAAFTTTRYTPVDADDFVSSEAAFDDQSLPPETEAAYTESASTPSMTYKDSQDAEEDDLLSPFTKKWLAIRDRVNDSANDNRSEFPLTQVAYQHQQVQQVKPTATNKAAVKKPATKETKKPAEKKRNSVKTSKPGYNQLPLTTYFDHAPPTVVSPGAINKKHPLSTHRASTTPRFNVSDSLTTPTTSSMRRSSYRGDSSVKKFVPPM